MLSTDEPTEQFQNDGPETRIPLVWWKTKRKSATVYREQIDVNAEEDEEFILHKQHQINNT